jgi:hypothetical protein
MVTFFRRPPLWAVVVLGALGSGCAGQGSLDAVNPDATLAFRSSDPESAEDSGESSEDATDSPGHYVSYTCAEGSLATQGFGFTTDEAVEACVATMEANPGLQLLCTLDGVIVYDGCDGRESAAPTGTDRYEAAFCDSGVFIQTDGISRDMALANCRLNEAYNPGRGVYCTWNGEVIYDSCGESKATEAPVAGPGACESWEPAELNRAPETIDETYWSAESMNCSGPSFRRFDPRYGLWVGLVSCDPGYRFYLAESEEGPFLPAADGGGHGQDLCELVDPTFTLPLEDDITSGGCTTCSTGWNYSFVAGEVYVRSAFGQPFLRAEALTWGGYQSSVITCATGPIECSVASDLGL